MKLCGIYCVISALNLFYLNYVLRFTSRLSYQQSFFISRIFVTHVPIQCWVFGQITVPREFAKVRVDPGGLWWNLPSLPQKKSPWTQAEQNFIHTKSAGFKRTDLTCSPKSTWISKKMDGFRLTCADLQVDAGIRILSRQVKFAPLESARIWRTKFWSAWVRGGIFWGGLSGFRLDPRGFRRNKKFGRVFKHHLDKLNYLSFENEISMANC